MGQLCSNWEWHIKEYITFIIVHRLVLDPKLLTWRSPTSYLCMLVNRQGLDLKFLAQLLDPFSVRACQEAPSFWPSSSTSYLCMLVNRLGLDPTLLAKILNLLSLYACQQAWSWPQAFGQDPQPLISVCLSTGVVLTPSFWPRSSTSYLRMLVNRRGLDPKLLAKILNLLSPYACQQARSGPKAFGQDPQHELRSVLVQWGVQPSARGGGGGAFQQRLQGRLWHCSHGEGRTGFGWSSAHQC